MSDPVELFLQTLHDGSRPEFQNIATKALQIYRSTGRLTVNLRDWALRTAGFQNVEVPKEFDSVIAFTPGSKRPTVQPPAPMVAAPTPTPAAAPAPAANDAAEIMATALLEVASALIDAADQLRGR